VEKVRELLSSASLRVTANTGAIIPDSKITEPSKAINAGMSALRERQQNEIVLNNHPRTLSIAFVSL
jgi:hypothetical protein